MLCCKTVCLRSTHNSDSSLVWGRVRVQTLEKTDAESFFQRVAIVGLGLLGGSWGLAL